ncbi:MAG TPA: VWA domain-containing protein [Humisphaera sp.]|jgi:hypothetical protein|nr:VWA domain-containing protein [Humisphaera sp.]
MRSTIRWINCLLMATCVCFGSATLQQAHAQQKPNPLPERVPAKQDREPKGLAGVGLTAEQVNASIDKGAAFLWNWIKENDLKGNRVFGNDTQHLICSLALVHAGAHKKFPDFDAALRDLLGRVKPETLSDRTYNVGLLCMLVESYGDPTFYPVMQRAARLLFEGQGPKGTWDYVPMIKPEVLADPDDDQPLRVAGGFPLDGTGIAAPWQRTTTWESQHDKDNSVTQYALLGLHSASRSGIKLPDEVWKRNLDTTRQRQTKDGGFNYESGGAAAYGSMTAAGICAMALDRFELGEKDVNNDEGIERGLGWLAQKFTVDKNPESSQYHFYYLYSLERVGRILDTEFIGEHEWYPLGAKYLVTSQFPDGHWESKSDNQYPRLPASFALLFLTRATPSLNVAHERGGNGTLRTGVKAAPGQRLYVILDASGSMIDMMGDKRKFDIARGAVDTIIQGMPDNSQVGLRVYGHRKNSLQPGADQDTELLIPFGPLNKKTFSAKTAQLRARGKTPLALSLTEAQKDLSGAAKANGDPLTVILLTDGGEDTFPRQDPLKAAREFAKLPNVHFYIVGFDVASRPDWITQLQSMAKLANGMFLPAAEGDTLIKSMKSAVYMTPDTYVVSQDGKPIIDKGEFGSTVQLPEGKYNIKATYAGRSFDKDFWINTNSMTAVIFDAAKVKTPPATMPAR